MMILYGLVADYKIYSTTDATGSGGDVLQHYGKFQDVRVPPCPNPAPRTDVCFEPSTTNGCDDSPRLCIAQVHVMIFIGFGFLMTFLKKSVLAPDVQHHIPLSYTTTDRL